MTKETQRNRDICTFDYSVRVMNNHTGSTLTWPTGTMFSHINTRLSCLRGTVVSGTRDHITRPSNVSLLQQVVQPVIHIAVT